MTSSFLEEMSATGELFSLMRRIGKGTNSVTERFEFTAETPGAKRDVAAWIGLGKASATLV
jgi:hypothetical protein